MTAFYPFPSIKNGRYVIDSIVKKFMPSDITFVEVEGITKLHGTSAAIVKHAIEGPITLQSRSRIVTPEDDNSSFATLMSTDTGMSAVQHMFSQIEALAGQEPINWPIIVYGEWCGRGIQRNVAVSRMEKTFVIFKIAFGTTWADMDRYKDVAAPSMIRNIREIPPYSFTLHKNSLQKDLLAIDKVVQDIDQQCPFAYHLYRLEGPGEGLVLKPKNASESDFWWKAKGESHQRSVPRVEKRCNSVPDTALDFAHKHVTFERLESAKEAQHISTATDENILKHYPVLLKWMIKDIEREESFDGLDVKQASRAIGLRLKELLLVA